MEQGFYQGTFAGTVLADNTKVIPLVNGKVDVFGYYVVVIAERQILTD